MFFRRTKRRTEITVETHRITVVRKTAPPLEQIGPACGATTSSNEQIEMPDLRVCDEVFIGEIERQSRETEYESDRVGPLAGGIRPEDKSAPTCVGEKK